MDKMIHTFKKIVDNPISKFLIRRMLSKCKKDNESKLEAALEHYITGDNKCLLCKLDSYILGYIIKKGSEAFGVDEEEVKERMKDPYWAMGLINVLKGIATFGVKKPFVPGSPFQVVWNITQRCNMNCKHCYESKGNSEELGKEDVMNIIDIISSEKIPILAFSGGEPSIHPNILDYIEYASEKGLYVAMATNGFIFSNKERCKEFEEAGLKFVQISLDGLNPKTHDEFRGVNGAWKRACEAIKNFSKTEVFVEVATTVTKNNYKEILGMVDLVEKLGADWLMLYNFVPVGRGSKNVDMDISPKDRYRLLEKIYALNYEREIEILSTAPQFASVATKKSGEIIPTHFYNPKYESNEIRQLADFIGGCGAGRFYLSLEPNGDIYPCVFFPHDEHVKLGNILEDDFREIWEKNEVLWKLRNRNLLKGHCKTCVNRDICGGCRARAYAYFSDVCAPDPGCIHNEKWMEIKNERRYINKSSRHHRHKRKIKI